MNKARDIFLLLFCFALSARANVLDTTNATRFTTWSDSFSRSIIGQRQNFIIGSYPILYHPTNFNTYRDHSAGGHDNTDMVQHRMPKYGVPEDGLLAGLTNSVGIYYVSGNNPMNSNAMFTNFQQILQYPTNIYNQAGVMTNDPIAVTHSALVIGDPPYDTADGQFSGLTLAYNSGAKAAALLVGAPFIDSFANISNDIVPRSDKDNYYVTINSTHDHPGNEVQGMWVLTDFQSLGCDTNTFSFVIDYNNAVARSSNHCAIGTITTQNGELTFPFHADRMAPVLYYPDGTTTNNMWGAFALKPSLTNTFVEMLTFTNMQYDAYQLEIDGHVVTNLTAVNGRVDFNLWMNPNHAFQHQAQTVLYLMCDMQDVSRTDQASDAHPGDNRLNENYESQASNIWPTNTLGNTAYVTMLKTFEDAIAPTDVLINTAAQQTNHTITLKPIFKRYLLVSH